MAADVVLVLQGGGALGAFECGVWKALAPALRAGGHRVRVIGGASIGALNAAVIASHYDDADQGVGVLERFWRESLATEPLPFLPLPGSYFEAWNGLLTGLLWGNRSLYRPQYLNWHPAAALQRLTRPLFDTAPMRRTLREALGGPCYQPGPRSPVLFMRSTDLLQGRVETFHSRRHLITTEMLRASAALPLLFTTIALDGSPHVDGDANVRSALGGALDVLGELDAQAFDGDEAPLLINVELHRRADQQLPCTAMEMSYRLVDALQAGKSEADLELLRSESEHAEVMRELDRMLSTQPDSAPARLVRQQLAQLKLRRAPGVRPRIVQIGREAALPHEHVSNLFDYSPARIDALIEQGMQEARRSLRRELPELAQAVEDEEAARQGRPAPSRQRRPHLRVVV